MFPERFKYLLNTYLEDTITDGEKNDFFEAVSTDEFDEILSLSFDKSINEIDNGNVVSMPVEFEKNILKTIMRSENIK